MGVTVEWDDADQTTLRYDISGKWTWDELHGGRETVFDMMDAAAEGRIYAIIYFTEGRINIPRGMMQQFSKLITHSHPKAGLTVIVGATLWMKRTAGLLKNTYSSLTGQQVDFAYADTLEQARQLIEQEHRKRKVF